MDNPERTRELLEYVSFGGPLAIVFDPKRDEHLTLGQIKKKSYELTRQLIIDNITFSLVKVNLDDGYQVIEYWEYGYKDFGRGNILYCGEKDSVIPYDNRNISHVELLLDEGGVKIIIDPKDIQSP
jgi:hypothetical protein